MDLSYDLEADFFPLTTCDFRCAYCFVPPDALGAKIRRYGTNEQWQAGFDALGKTWLIHVTGGEPFLYPDFVDLCERLSRRHYLSINSNLSSRPVDDFAGRVDPRRVHFFNAAIHLEERRRKGSLDPFVARAHRLRDAGFHVLLSLVMTPAMVESFPAIAREFASWGLAIVPKTLRGAFEGRRYPDAYDARQKALIRDYLARAREAYAGVTEAMGEAPTIDMVSDGRFLDGLRSYRGLPCGSGYNFVAIAPDGSVLRCGSGQRLGNLLARDVRLLHAPRPCDTSYCPYFCEKYTSPRFAAGRRDVPETFTFTQDVGMF